MLRSVCEDENDLFFDSAEVFPFDEPNVANVELGCSGFGYDIWLNGPLSVKDRREKFLRGMGFNESLSQDETEMAVEELQEKIELNRLAMCSGAVSCSCESVRFTGFMDKNSVCSRSALENDANCMVEVLDSLEEVDFNRELGGSLHCEVNLSHIERWNHNQGCRNVGSDKKKIAQWWKLFSSRRKSKETPLVSEACEKAPKSPGFDRLKVKCNNKRWMELSALYSGQEIQAHNGIIWTMKFSPDSQYLASGGEDGVVRVWRIKSADPFFKNPTAGSSASARTKNDHSASSGTKSSHVPFIMPNKVFWIDESPFQEFFGHKSDVLDLAWSNSNNLLSCSKDKTVRLWKLGCEQCMKFFPHNDYVTCLQFNPIDENYFISGSIDGKARIWGVHEGRVIDWADIHDLITTICYRPNGKGFAVGCITGSCHFFDTSGCYLRLETVIHTHGRRKTSNNRITSIQFSQENERRMMISSGDSKVRLFEDMDVVYKYGGAPKSRCQMSASFTPTGKHIVSVGEDSQVYIRNYDGSHLSPCNMKSDKSCEHFYSEGATVALAWSAMGQGYDKNLQFSHSLNRLEATPTPRESECFSLGNWFSIDNQWRGSATWPEEQLPTMDVSVSRNDCPHGQRHGDNTSNHIALSETWGLVILTASVDGTIRTFHNYGLPVRL